MKLHIDGKDATYVAIEASKRGPIRVGAHGFLLPTAPWKGPRRGAEKSEINPVDRRLSAASSASDSAPECGAKTMAGTPCQHPPVPGRKRCRLHGGLSAGAPRGRRNGNYTNGEWTAEAIEERRWLRSLVRAFAKTEAG
jgi:glucans biosynthesis protein